MKKILLVTITILAIILALASDGLIMGQPPDPPGGHGLNGNHGSGGPAPLGGGSIFMVLGGLGYGVYRLIRGNLRKKDDA